ncbi:oxysterol-binding protein-related protein 1 isoform X2 [Manduca sexta]|uniref:oxysterol-binding protein-related protein 1 isoform X2 n=1 Tax=Manduca sexta TaxID=7130 RepID=UPI0011836917|nr:oxysterol-binding protein-related protein 1 isoform X2 [Manduca sexta]
MAKEGAAVVEAQESLLYSARHGELAVVKALLEAKAEGKLTLNVSCKGKSKSNLGWTPLHLATYFGHVDVAAALLEAGANVDEVNDTGDTALHKASFIGNEDLVILLLKYKADVNIMNGEGRTPCDVSKNRDVQRLLEAAQRAERHERESKLLTAAKEGRVEDIHELLSSQNPPNINCVDAQGNTCLHCAAYRGHARLAVLLLQNGIDTTLRNHSGQLAIELAKDNEMREVLSVRPVQRLQRTAARFEGPLLKRSRFLGWRPVWSWITALNEHIAYSGHYLWAGASPDTAKEATEDLEDDCKPLGSMQDALTAATNSLALLETQLRECSAIVAALDKSVNVGNSLHHSAYMRFQHACGTGSEALSALRHCAALVHQARDADVARLNRELERNRVLEEALAALARTHHALEMSVAEELNKGKRKKKSSSTLNESKENFFDVFDDSDEDDTLVTAGLSSPLGALSPWGSSPDLTRRTPIGSVDGDKTPTNEEDRQLCRQISGSSDSAQSLHSAGSAPGSLASSRGTLVSQGGHVYRNARPYRRCTQPSSQWSL